MNLNVAVHRLLMKKAQAAQQMWLVSKVAEAIGVSYRESINILHDKLGMRKLSAPCAAIAFDG